ncbi:MAG: TIGR02921 family PEP-CTERM protein [Symploca sp. SIO2B6]|nr:TIGR02921 family PEP-CTERM protein [Symploca sp. SIO2B6]
MKKLINISFHAIFWLWNLTFLAIVYAGMLPLIGFVLILATLDGEIPVEFSLTFLALIAVPTVCTVIGARRLRKQPTELMRLFYGVEAPLFLLCLLRLFLLRELTPASNLILGTVLLSILAFSVELLRGYDERQQTIAWLQMVAHSLMLVIGIYVGLLLLFYALPAAATWIVAFLRFEWLGHLWYMATDGMSSGLWLTHLYLFCLLILSYFLFFVLSATLFLAMPSVLTALYLHSGYRVIRFFASRYGKSRALIGAIASITAWIIIFVSFSVQPQVQAFELLENSPKTDSERQALLAKSELIRTGLVNANLSPYRYLSIKQENNHIRYMYRSVFNLPEVLCQFLQNSYNQLMSPFLYDGSRSDIDKAEKLYAEFFDTPLQKAQRQEVQHAIQSTFNREEVKAGLLNINQKFVWLAKQQINIQEQGNWAEVELYEVYENQTNEQQEIFYYFSLPESAVVTGVWLGESENRNERYPFAVSPRGAAQQVYNQEVRRRVDPALLEQVGPRHYRLRAFPFPPRRSRLSQSQEQQEQAKLHLWLTYKVMRDEKGWQLPQLGEKRNVFWNQQTQRIRNGKVQTSSLDTWLEPFLPATGQHQPNLHEVNLTDGYRITAKPLSQCRDKSCRVSTPTGKRLAIVLDTSRSMRAHSQEVADTFKWLQEQGFADNSFTNNDADLYITDSADTQPKRLDDIRRFQPQKMTFYGSIQLKEMLQQFVQLRDDTVYDGILLVTDEGSYELSDDSKDLPKMSAPLWVVHLGGQLPPAYDDATLEAIQDSGGGVASKLPEVIQRLATKEALGSSVVNVVDGYTWFMEQTNTETSSKNGFEQLAARQLVLGLSQKLKGASELSLKELDAIHKVAKTFDIVTPYSSMIVLVNERQKEALKRAEAASDRFDREVESGKEQLSKPFDPLTVSGVPEPEEWMLMGITAVALLFIVRRQRRLTN